MPERTSDSRPPTRFVRRGLALFVLFLLDPVARPVSSPPAAGAPPLSTAAEEGDDRFTPPVVSKLRSAIEVAIAPDGRRVATLVSVPRRLFEEEDGPSWTELHLVDPDGTTRPFLTGPQNPSGIDWTPDGKGISFLAKRAEDKTTCLYVIPFDGGEARRVLAHATDLLAYAWSPEATRVAFTAKDEEDPERKKRSEKGFKAEIYEEDWTRVGLWIAPVAPDAEKPRRLGFADIPQALDWSPDGAALAVVATPTPLVDDTYVRKSIRIVDAETGRETSRIANPGKLGPAVWSPDGRRLAFLSAADPSDHREGRPMVAELSTGAFRDLLPGFEGHGTQLAWRNETTLLLLADEGVHSTLREIPVEGGPGRILLPAGGPIFTAFDLSPESGSVALLGHTPAHPSEVFLWDKDASQARRLTETNPALASMRFARQEAIEWKARDGLRLEGILLHPLDESPGQAYPCILSVHGGPEAHVSHGWVTSYSSPGQVAAARGFVVFYPNYRGSTGRGVAFSKLSKDDPAGKEFDDLVDGIDHLIALGLVDREKVGITGGSYGGYATAWGATYYSERFAAGVMFVGISDTISKAGTSDIPNEMYQVHDSRWPWEDWSFFLERSPIYHVEKARTPLLILHGKEDPRVPPGQSMELYRHLKVLGKTPARLVLYPGEGHGNRKAASRYDYHLRMLQWMEHYLQGPGGAPPPHAIELPGAPEDEEDEAPPAQ